MKYYIQETNGKKTYMVNDIRYERLEDVPAEYRHLFEDKNNNNIPDGFEIPVDMSSPWAMIKSLFRSEKHDVRDAVKSAPTASRKSTTYDKGNEPTFRGTIVKIIVVSLLVFGGYWVYNVYQNPNTDSGVQDSTEQVTITDDIQSTEEPIVEGDAAPVEDPRENATGNNITVTLEDPNEAPYHVFISFKVDNNVIFNMEAPQSPMQLSDIESMTELQFFSEGLSGTTLSGKSIRYEAYPGPCELDSNFEWVNLTLSQVPFKKCYYDDGAAGHTYKNYIYQLTYQGNCIRFSLTYNLVNPGLVEGEIKDFDIEADVKAFEEELARIKFQ